MAKNTRTSVREPIMRIVKRDGMGVIPRIMVYVIAIVLALVVDALFIYFVTGLNPFDVYKVMFGGLWWVSVFPGLYIVLIVFAVNMLGDFLRDELNPKLK